MTLQEAQAIAAICSTADTGCSTCVGKLQGQLEQAFPAFTWTYARNPEPAPDYNALPDDADWPEYLDHMILVVERKTA